MDDLEEIKEQAIYARNVRQEYGLSKEYWEERKTLESMASTYLTEELDLDEDAAESHASQLSNNVGINHIYEALELPDAWDQIENLFNYEEQQAVTPR